MTKGVIAIDGPAGAGKSTIAKLVAEKLGYIYIDTGAMYRAVTLEFLNSKKPYSDALVSDIAKNIDITFKREPDCNHVYVNKKEVTSLLRSSEVTKNVSKVSAVGEVRIAMVEAQRKIGSQGKVVMDGRDIGTVVFPKADIKIFLTASVEERAKRRFLELKSKGEKVNIEDLQKDIATRDKLDTEREVAPLRCAEDAIYLDTSSMNIDEVVNKILEISKESSNVL